MLQTQCCFRHLRKSQALARTSTFSGVEMLRGRREGGREDIKHDNLSIMIAFIIHLIVTSMMSLVLSQASHSPGFM